MDTFNPVLLKQLSIPKISSHKGQNGKVLVVAGSKLFHAAALWSLQAVSHIVDMVYFSSIDENNDIVREAKKEFRNGIVIPRSKVLLYAKEADCILLGPGLPRKDGMQTGDDDTRELTQKLLISFPDKKWVIDGGSLQCMEEEWIPRGAIITPHVKEFSTLFKIPLSQISNIEYLISKQFTNPNSPTNQTIKLLEQKAEQHKCVILLKGKEDIICTGVQKEITKLGNYEIGTQNICTIISGGNAGMTKGGTGDVLAGITAGLYAQNDDPYLVASCASYINKKAGDECFKEKGYWYTTTDLLTIIPKIMKKIILE